MVSGLIELSAKLMKTLFRQKTRSFPSDVCKQTSWSGPGVSEIFRICFNKTKFSYYKGVNI